MTLDSCYQHLKEIASSVAVVAAAVLIAVECAVVDTAAAHIVVVVAIQGVVAARFRPGEDWPRHAWTMPNAGVSK